MENGHKVWYLDCWEPVKGRFTYSSNQGISKMKIRFSVCAGGFSMEKEMKIINWEQEFLYTTE